MRNTKECVLKMQSGQATIVCPFVGGNLQSRQPIPATYTTSNAVIQGVLESSQMFQGGKIYVVAEYPDTDAPKEEVETAAKKTAAKAKKETKKREPRVMENVRTHGDAVAALMTDGEVKASDLVDVESCIRKAEELGISFPNLKA